MKKTQDTCDIFCYDEELVERVKPRVDAVVGMEIIFKALSDATRMRIAYALTLEEELCVCDVANIIGCTTASASHHLRSLRKAGLAEYRKEGKLVFYTLSNPFIKDLVAVAIQHSEDQSLKLANV